MNGVAPAYIAHAQIINANRMRQLLMQTMTDGCAVNGVRGKQ